MKKVLLLIVIICSCTINYAQTYGANWLETIDWLNIQLDKKNVVKVESDTSWKNDDYSCDIDYNGRIRIKFMDDDFNTFRLTANLKDFQSYYKDENVLELKFSPKGIKSEVLHFSTIKKVFYEQYISFDISEKGLSVRLLEGFNQLFKLTKKGEIKKSSYSHQSRSHLTMKIAIKKMLAQHEQMKEMKATNLESVYKYKGSEIAKTAFIKGYKNIYNNQNDIKSSSKLFTEAVIHDPSLIFLKTMIKNGELNRIGKVEYLTAVKKLNSILTYCSFKQKNQRVFYKLLLLQINGEKDDYKYFSDVLSELRITSGYKSERIALAKALLRKTNSKAFRRNANAKIYQRRAIAYRILDNPERGLEEINKAFKVNPRAECLENRAHYYSWYKNYEMAIKDLEEARKLYLEQNNERKAKSVDQWIKMFRGH